MRDLVRSFVYELKTLGLGLVEGIADMKRKGSGNMLTEMPKVGDELRYVGDLREYLTLGKSYEVASVGLEWFYYTDDDGDKISESKYDFEDWELVPKPHPDVRDLLANLGRRLSEVEASIAPEYDAEVFPSEDSDDAVNSPQHYKRGKFETIEVIEEITSGYSDGFVAHCAGTAIKYIARAPYKHATPTEDLMKAAKYLEFAIKRAEASE